MATKFYYFGFGSNMLAKRIHIQNPSAVRIGPGRLENYRLDFHTSSRHWLGAPATIVPTPNAHVYGSIWEIDISNLKDLDDQEGVSAGIYIPITVSVHSIANNSVIECRAYHLTNQPNFELNRKDIDSIPHNRQPSKTYLKVLIKGAIETQVPAEYINWLRTIKHNGQLVDTMEQKLQLETLNF